MERLPEFNGLQVVGMAFLALCGDALFGDIFFCVNYFRLSMSVLPAEGNEDLRMEVGGNVHKLRPFGVGDKQHRGIVAFYETEPLDIESFGGAVPIKYGPCLSLIQFLNPYKVSLILVDRLVISRIECTVAENSEYLVFS